MANVEMKVRVKRDGLVLILETMSGKLVSTFNLQEHLGLSDEQAKELLAQLDERDRQKAEDVQ